MSLAPRQRLVGIDAIVFDKDGTLIDVHATWGPAMVSILLDLIQDDLLRGRAAAAVGVDLGSASLAEDSPVIAETNAEIAARLAFVLDDEATEVGLRFEALVTKHVADTMTPLATVEPMLRSLREAGFWLGVATNDGEKSARRQLDRLGWSDLFDSVLGYDSGYGGKPGPGMVEASAAVAGCGVSGLLMVGDTPTDISAAASAGCRSILIDPGRRFDTKATVVIDSPSQIVGLLRR